MNIFAKITCQTMKQNKIRTIVSIIGVILATSMVTGVLVFGGSVQNYMLERGKRENGEWHLYEEALTKEEYEETAKYDDVKKCVSIRELGYGDVSFLRQKNIQKIANYLYMQTMNPEAAELLGVKLSEGRLPENENEIILQEETITMTSTQTGEQYRVVDVGDTITVTVGDWIIDGEKITGNPWIEYQEQEDKYENFAPKYERTYTIVGILESWGNSNMGGGGMDAFTGDILSKEHQEEDKEAPYNTYVQLKNPRNIQNFIETKGKGTSWNSNEAVLKWIGASRNSAYMTFLDGIMQILIFIIGIGSISLIYNTFAISLRERTTQFGILSSVGATNKQLKKAMWYEAASVAVIGIPFGILAGVGGIAVTLHYIGPWLGGWIHGDEETIRLHVYPYIIPMTILIVFILVCLSVWVPVRRIRKITPMQAIRATKDIKIRSKKVKSPKYIFKLFGVEGMLADKNYKRDRKKYRATVFSLTISIILFVSASLLSEYLISTGAFVMKMPEYEILYTSRDYKMDEMEELETENKKIEQVLDEIEGVERYQEYKDQFIYFDVEEARIWCNLIFIPDDEFVKYTYGNNPVYYDKYVKYDTEKGKYVEKEFFDGKENLTLRYYREQVIPTENGEYNTKLSEEKEIILSHSIENLPDYLFDSQESGYGNVIILVPESRMEEYLFKDDLFNSVESNIAIKATQYNSVYQELEKKMTNEELLENGYLSCAAKDYEKDRGMLLSVKVLTYGFIVLISLIATANVFNTISTNVMLRKREFAMLQSMGMSRKMLHKMMNYECLIYGFKSISYGVIGSLLISVLLFGNIARSAQIQFVYPWKPLFVAIIWVMIVVFCSMLYSIQKIKKQNVIEELKRE